MPFFSLCLPEVPHFLLRRLENCPALLSHVSLPYKIKRGELFTLSAWKIPLKFITFSMLYIYYSADFLYLWEKHIHQETGQYCFNEIKYIYLQADLNIFSWENFHFQVRFGSANSAWQIRHGKSSLETQAWQTRPKILACLSGPANLARFWLLMFFCISSFLKELEFPADKYKWAYWRESTKKIPCHKRLDPVL